MKILIVGLGSIGIRHARLLNQNFPDELELHAFRTGKGQKSLSDRLSKDIKMADSLREACQQKPDVAFITNPTNHHISTAKTCAEVGAHLFIEKPLSNSMKGIDGLISTINKNNLITLVGCQLRFHPVIRKTKEYLENDVLGSVFSFRARCGSYLSKWRPDQDYRKSYSAKSSMGGGVVLDLIHELDFTHWLFDDIREVGGKTEHTGNLDIETEDVAEIHFRFAKNGLGNIHLNYLQNKPIREYTISGTEGTLKGDLIENELTVQSDGKEVDESYDVSRNDLFREEHEYFFKCLQEGQQTFNSVQKNKNILRRALKVKR